MLQIGNSLSYVGSKHQKAFMVELKRVYKALNKAAAESALRDLKGAEPLRPFDKLPLTQKIYSLLLNDPVLRRYVLLFHSARYF